MKELDYEIISTGSQGNAVRIDTVLVDCGVPFKKLKDVLFKVKTLLITHKHSDHVNESTLRMIKKKFPLIRIVSNYEVYMTFSPLIDEVVNAEYKFKTASGIITPFECVHNAVTYGYYWKRNGQQIFYATDTSSLVNVPKDLKIDYCFLESNYDEEKLERVVKAGNMRTRFGYDVRNGCLRHLSTQACKGFFYTHRKTKDAKLIELHMSSRFY